MFKGSTIGGAGRDWPSNNASTVSLTVERLAGGARGIFCGRQKPRQPVESHVEGRRVGVEERGQLGHDLSSTKLADGEGEPELDATGVGVGETCAKDGEVEGALLVAITTKADAATDKVEALLIGTAAQPTLHVNVTAGTASGLHQGFWMVVRHNASRRLAQRPGPRTHHPDPLYHQVQDCGSGWLPSSQLASQARVWPLFQAPSILTISTILVSRRSPNANLYFNSTRSPARFLRAKI